MVPYCETPNYKVTCSSYKFFNSITALPVVSIWQDLCLFRMCRLEESVMISNITKNC